MKTVSVTENFFSDLPASMMQAHSDLTLVEANSGTDDFSVGMIAVSAELEPNQVVDLAVRGAQHVVQKGTNYIQDLESLTILLQEPEKYFSDSFGLASLLENKQQILFSKTADKAALIEQVEKYIGEDGHQSFKESVRAIIEEMYMNAIFDAPKEAQKKGLVSVEAKPYDKGLTASIQLGWQGERLYLSCRDPYGSLDPMKFLLRMQEVYRKGAGEVINMKPGAGAGLGCVVLFENCVQLSFGVKPGEATIFSCMVPKKLNYRQRASQKKNLHLL